MHRTCVHGPRRHSILIAAIAGLSQLPGDSGDNAAPLIIAVNLFTVIAMFARNLILPTIFSPAEALPALCVSGRHSIS